MNTNIDLKINIKDIINFNIIKQKSNKDMLINLIIIQLNKCK